jgi:hypothetical protein
MVLLGRIRVVIEEQNENMGIRVIIFMCICQIGFSQSAYQMKGNDKAIDVDFLTSYYHQDGNNSAVQGGVGTEELIDVANIIVINIPLDSVRSINATVGADFYSSASTDMIDANLSSASSKDLRAYASLGYQQKNLRKGTTFGIRGGFSNEYDYTSFNGGLNFAKEWNEGNTELNLQVQGFIDSWRPVFPAELRRTVSIPTKKRNSFNVSAVFSQVLTKRLQIALSGEVVYMEGLLSTPFHRVYFSDTSLPDIERLPSSRLKIPLSIRLNYFAFEYLVIRSYYRFYTDDFGIRAHTASLELPIKFSQSFSVAPFVRYHTQKGSNYFAPFREHISTETFYTSDFDLSTLSSKKVGLAIGYHPVFGLANGKLFNRNIAFKSIEFRVGYYMRDTGLNSYIGSLNFKFQF